MAIAIVGTRNSLVTTYIGLGTWIGLATGNPGTTTTPANEATGGSPAYARKQTTWGSVSASASTGTAVTIDAAAGTYTFAILASAATTGAANQVDNCSITSTVLSAQGQVIVTPTYTQS
jgi:hypothetical protein